MDETHKKFLGILSESETARWGVARWLSKKGFCVRVPPLRKAPMRDVWQDYSDEGDLEVSLRIEVKRLGVNFTCAEDWPFRPKFIVCSKRSFDAASPKPFSYIILSNDGTHAARVRADTHGTWTTERKLDSRFNEWQEFYLAPMDVVSFERLE